MRITEVQVSFRIWHQHGAKMGGTRVQGQPRLHDKTLSRKDERTGETGKEEHALQSQHLQIKRSPPLSAT